MKKFFLLVPVAALAMTACTSESNEFVGDSQQQAREISFMPLAQNLTRAAGAAEYNAVEGTTYPQNYDMKVVAYSAGSGNYFGSATADDAPLFSYQFAGGTSAPLTNANYWGGDPAQYWPLSPATLNFLAVSNNGSPDADMVSEQFLSDYASGVNVTLGNNIPQDANSATTKGQHDLMYGFGTASVTQSVNALTFPEKADMTFSHALAWVYFRVKAGNAPSTAISVKDIKLKGANYGGSFQARLSNYSTTTPALAWNTSETKWTDADNQSDQYSPNFSADYNIKGATGAASNDSKSLVNGTFFNVGDGLLVVPTSELTPAETSMTSFDIEYYLNGNLYTYNYIPVDRTYEKGKKYIYDITMTLHEIFVDPTVVDWDENGNVGQFVDIPSYAIGQTIDYGTISKAEATYKFEITGCTGTPTIAVAGGSTAFKTNPTYSAGVVTFSVNANAGAARAYEFTITDTGGTAKVSTVTFTQAN